MRKLTPSASAAAANPSGNSPAKRGTASRSIKKRAILVAVRLGLSPDISAEHAAGLHAARIVMTRRFVGRPTWPEPAEEMKRR